MNSIKGFQGEYRWLSNFWPCIIVFDGLVFSSSEHAYQAAKCTNKKDMLKFTQDQHITSGQAKRLGRKQITRKDWNEVKFKIMKEIIAFKFNNNQELKNNLLSTGDAYIEETNTWNDTFWGVCRGIGENNLGKIIMNIRSGLMQ
jgi:ribA/ribD-fused uncharacterized protein